MGGKIKEKLNAAFSSMGWLGRGLKETENNNTPDNGFNYTGVHICYKLLLPAVSEGYGQNWLIYFIVGNVNPKKGNNQPLHPVNNEYETFFSYEKAASKSKLE